MKSFKEFVSEQNLHEQILSSKIVLFFESNDFAATEIAKILLKEGWSRELGKGYSVRFDRAHAKGQDHLHVLYKNNDISVINRDGTMSHGTNLSKVPGWVKDEIKSLNIVKINEAVENTEEESLKTLIEVRLYGPSAEEWISMLAEAENLIENAD